MTLHAIPALVVRSFNFRGWFACGEKSPFRI